MDLNEEIQEWLQETYGTHTLETVLYGFSVAERRQQRQIETFLRGMMKDGV